MSHRDFCAYQEWSTWSCHLLEGFTGSYQKILPVSSLRKGQEQHVPDSSNHALFPEKEGNLGGNQLPDGSISLFATSAQTNDLPVHIETSLRQGFP